MKKGYRIGSFRSCNLSFYEAAGLYGMDQPPVFSLLGLELLLLEELFPLLFPDWLPPGREELLLGGRMEDS